MKPTLTVTDLADRLGHGRQWLYQAGVLDTLYAQGMPRPISVIGRRIWDRAAVEAWLARPPVSAAPLTGRETRRLGDKVRAELGGGRR